MGRGRIFALTKNLPWKAVIKRTSDPASIKAGRPPLPKLSPDEARQMAEQDHLSNRKDHVEHRRNQLLAAIVEFMADDQPHTTGEVAQAIEREKRDVAAMMRLRGDLYRETTKIRCTVLRRKALTYVRIPMPPKQPRPRQDQAEFDREVQEIADRIQRNRNKA